MHSWLPQADIEGSLSVQALWVSPGRVELSPEPCSAVIKRQLVAQLVTPHFRDWLRSSPLLYCPQSQPFPQPGSPLLVEPGVQIPLRDLEADFLPDRQSLGCDDPW